VALAIVDRARGAAPARSARADCSAGGGADKWLGGIAGADGHWRIDAPREEKTQMTPPFEEDKIVESLEVTARTVNEAIEKALVQLRRSRDEVNVSVLSEGSRGILGIGGEEARILVSPRGPLVDAGVAPVVTREARVEPPRPEETPRPRVSIAEQEQVAETARDILENLLSGMRVPAEVEIKTVPESARDDGFAALLDVVGADDVGILIGRRGETLGALQFLTSLIVAKKVGRWSKVLVDVEGYRLRREASLRSLAQRIAQRVEQTNQPMALEAMPANERRVVHIALQEHPAVMTASTGEGDQRRVVISPKR